MIKNDNELQASQERIAFFYKILANMRLKATPEEYHLYSNSYLVEIDKMHAEVVEYLKKHPNEMPAEAA